MFQEFQKTTQYGRALKFRLSRPSEPYDSLNIENELIQ